MATLKISSQQLRFVVAGQMEVPRATYDVIWAWMLPWLEKAKYAQEAMATGWRITNARKRQKRSDDPERVARMDAVIAELVQERVKLAELAGTNGTTPAWRSLLKKFDADVGGWKYVDTIIRAPADSKAEANRLYGKITIQMVMTSSDIMGKWFPDKSAIVIWVDPRDEEMIPRAAEILEHELIHWAQWYMNAILGGEKFGMPPKDMRNPDIEQSPSYEKKRELRMEDAGESAFHSLDDYEFQPQGAMVISWIRERLERIDAVDRREALAAMLAVTDSHKYFAMPFVASLKKYSPGKWRRFVNEALTALSSVA
jgi:hypothetical protein